MAEPIRVKKCQIMCTVSSFADNNRIKRPPLTSDLLAVFFERFDRLDLEIETNFMLAHANKSYYIKNFIIQSIPLNWDTSGLGRFVPIKRLSRLSEVHCFSIHLFGYDD
ncbi:hypothetical protein RF11_10471 [Thelohanellus kitauei]|uniref:Uncharacterized protein n=1 Tax=Thelohanellus kitauei TaxID=669202 RepID=A0A0C2MIP3_THEKT|nr:hypothetical protein RF11_10471 [Thelohanellus kitauei]